MSGPITPAQFDQQANQPGASATFNFLDGYDQTYDTADTSESIEVLLADFTTQAGATSFAATNAIDPSEAPTQSSVPAIPGATALDSTKPDKDGLYSHVITASRGTRAMVIQYAIDSSGAAPAVLMMLAVQQYSRL